MLARLLRSSPECIVFIKVKVELLLTYQERSGEGVGSTCWRLFFGLCVQDTV